MNLAALRGAGVAAPGVAEALYERLLDQASWCPYPDTVAALRAVRDAGLPVAVVSNIAWEIGEVFARADALDLVDEFVLSYVEGAMKPDAKLFRIACERIGVEPGAALMVGDSAEADGGAAELGCAVEIVPPEPVAERPHALLDALASHGIG